MIELEHVEKRYGPHAVVADVSFRVPEGETLVLLGRSGSGKTTTLKTINRLVEPTGGVVRVFGEPVNKQPKEELRRRIGYVIQAVGLFPHYTIEENVAVVPRLLGWSKARIDARLDELFTLIGLARQRFGRRRPAELSGGQQQRVGLARALAADPPIVLLDEPFGALDPVTRREIQAEFVAVSRKLGKTMVLVTHDVAEAIAVGDRICLIEAGRVAQIGPAQELLFEPRTEVVRTFFDRGRLTLELLATSIEDVLPNLVFDARLGGSAALPVSTSLLEALEDRRAVEGGSFDVTGARGEALGSANAKAVIEAFYAFRAARTAK
jgi:osmoprotectant transport system ATP-binding protein